MLEKYFDISINVIIENVGKCRDLELGLFTPKNVEVFKMLGMTYFRTEILEYVQSGWESIDGVTKMFEKLSAGPSTYISFLSKKNMFRELPINMEFEDDIRKQWKFLHKLDELSRVLRPSQYGTQMTNWVDQYRLNEFINDILVKDIKSYMGDADEAFLDDGYYTQEIEIVKNHFLLKRDKKIKSIIN